MKIPKIYIVCGVHNDLEYTKRFLKSAFELNYKDKEIVIIDDGSTDGTSKYISKHYPEVKILHGKGNLWWTGSIYIGVKYVLKKYQPTDFILIINNDCTFDKEYLNVLVKFAQKDRKKITGSLIIDQVTGDVIDAGVNIDWRKSRFVPLKFNRLKSKIKLAEVDTLSTKGTLYPVTIFKEIGNFDKKNFPHYLSDYEFSCRAKKNGYKLLINYNAIVKNDSKRTGTELDPTQKVKIKNLLMILFSKKSKNNIKDQVKFFYKYSPSKYKLSIIKYILLKSIYQFTET